MLVPHLPIGFDHCAVWESSAFSHCHSFVVDSLSPWLVLHDCPQTDTEVVLDPVSVAPSVQLCCPLCRVFLVHSALFAVRCVRGSVCLSCSHPGSKSWLWLLRLDLNGQLCCMRELTVYFSTHILLDICFSRLKSNVFCRMELYCIKLWLMWHSSGNHVTTGLRLGCSYGDGFPDGITAFRDAV